MKHTSEWEIDIGIPIETKEGVKKAIEMGEQIEVLVGKKSHSSGAGFGYRDL